MSRRRAPRDAMLVCEASHHTEHDLDAPGARRLPQSWHAPQGTIRRPHAAPGTIAAHHKSGTLWRHDVFGTATGRNTCTRVLKHDFMRRGRHELEVPWE